MGRPRGRKHKLRYELQSVRDKSFENRLQHLARHHFGVCEAETVSVVAVSLDYLRAAQPATRDPLDVCLALPAGRDLLRKAAPEQLDTSPVRLSPCAEHDLDLWLELGVQPVQTARVVRLIEQADRAGCTAPLSQLVSLVHLGTRTISRRLEPLWKRGLRLPVMGIRASVQGPACRLSVLLGDHLCGKAADQSRRELLLSPAAYGQLLRTAFQVAKAYAGGRSPDDIAASLRLSPAEVHASIAVLVQADKHRSSRARLQRLLDSELGPDEVDVLAEGVSALQRRSSFEAHLIRRHRFSPVRAELLATEVERAARNREGLDRQDGDIVYWAISDQEPAGKARTDCELVAVALTFYDPDTDHVRRGRSSVLKLHKAARLAAEARRQGGLVCMPDLAFLIGFEASALHRAIKGSGLFVPTRGAIIDIGRGVTHRAQIVRQYVEGYTDTEIVRRTHHSYSAVTSYIEEFRRVMLLCDRALPPEHIRKILGRSLKLINEYIALYRELDQPQHQWKLNLMRHAQQIQEKKRSKSS